MVSRLVSLRDSDWVLVGVLLVLATLGVVQIYSATATTRFAGAHWKQIYWIVLGLGLLAAGLALVSTALALGVIGALLFGLAVWPSLARRAQ